MPNLESESPTSWPQPHTLDSYVDYSRKEDKDTEFLARRIESAWWTDLELKGLN